MAVRLDPTIRVRPSESLLSAVNSLWLLEDEEHGGEEMPRALKEATPRSELTVEDVRWIYDRSREHTDLLPEDFRFHEALSECELVLPQPEYAPRNPQLEARCQRLRAEAENREYERMTEHIDRKHLSSQRADEPIGRQVKELNSYLLLIGQFVVSVVTAFVAGYLAPYYLYGVVDSGEGSSMLLF